MALYRRLIFGSLVCLLLTSLGVPASFAATSPVTGPGTYTVTAANGDTMTMTMGAGASSPTAAAASTNHFSWTATISCCITSRQWTQNNSGSVIISSFVACNSATSSMYTIALYRYNTQQSPGPVTYSCGHTLQYTWTGQPTGNYSFRLQKRDDGVVQNFSGDVYYP